MAGHAIANRPPTITDPGLPSKHRRRCAAAALRRENRPVTAAALAFRHAFRAAFDEARSSALDRATRLNAAFASRDTVVWPAANDWGHQAARHPSTAPKMPSLNPPTPATRATHR
jgi:hypothetical protein